MFDRLAERLGLNAIPQIFFVSALLAVLFVAFWQIFSREFNPRTQDEPAAPGNPE